MNPTSKLIEPWIDAIKRAAGKQDIDPFTATLRALLAAAPVGKTYKGATVTDWSIPSSNPSDCSLASCRSCRAPR